MKVNLIVFNAGAGGNFLSRVVTLDPGTFPLGGLSNDVPTTEDRMKKYLYGDEFHTFTYNEPMPNGLSRWVDKELNELYFPLTSSMETLLEKNLVIIEALHPHHYYEKRCLFGSSDKIRNFYIDPTGCADWIIAQQSHKIRTSNSGSYDVIKKDLQAGIELLNEICKLDTFYAINLEQIIQGSESFLNEYKKLCHRLEVNCYEDLALQIYLSWKKTWA